MKACTATSDTVCKKLEATGDKQGEFDGGGNVCTATSENVCKGSGEAIGTKGEGDGEEAGEQAAADADIKEDDLSDDGEQPVKKDSGGSHPEPVLLKSTTTTGKLRVTLSLPSGFRNQDYRMAYVYEDGSNNSRSLSDPRCDGPDPGKVCTAHAPPPARLDPLSQPSLSSLLYFPLDARWLGHIRRGKPLWVLRAGLRFPRCRRRSLPGKGPGSSVGRA